MNKCARATTAAATSSSNKQATAVMEEYDQNFREVVVEGMGLQVEGKEERVKFGQNKRDEPIKRGSSGNSGPKKPSNQTMGSPFNHGRTNNLTLIDEEEKDDDQSS